MRRRALSRQEQRLQIIEKPASQGRCSKIHVVTLEQAAFLGFTELLFHQRQRESGSLTEQSHRNSVGKPQRVEHELEADFRARHFVLLEQGRSLFRPLHVLLRLLVAHLPHDAPLLTLLHARGSVSPLIEDRRIVTSFLQRLPDCERYYRYLLPLLPLAARWRVGGEGRGRQERELRAP